MGTESGRQPVRDINKRDKKTSRGKQKIIPRSRDTEIQRYRHTEIES